MAHLFRHTSSMLEVMGGVDDQPPSVDAGRQG